MNKPTMISNRELRDSLKIIRKEVGGCVHDPEMRELVYILCDLNHVLAITPLRTTLMMDETRSSYEMFYHEQMMLRAKSILPSIEPVLKKQRAA